MVYAAVQALPDSEPGKRVGSRWKRTSPENPFAAMCIARASADESKRSARGPQRDGHRTVADSHNAQPRRVVCGVDLARVLRPHLRDMAGQCFRWICRRQQAKADQWHARLIMLKNTAYAWRQMAFHLSFLDRDEVRAFVVWSEDNLAALEPGRHAGRFQPALRRTTAAILPP